MDCHEEVAILERTLKRLTGLEALDADVMAPAPAGEARRRRADAGAYRGSGGANRHARVARARNGRPAIRGRGRAYSARGGFRGAARRRPAGRLVPALARSAGCRLRSPSCSPAFIRPAGPGSRVRSRVLDINVLMVVAVARRGRARRVVRSGFGGVPVRARAAAGDARDGAGARRDPLADGPCAGRGGGSSRRHRRARAGRRRAGRRGDRGQAGGEDSARRHACTPARATSIESPVTGESLPVEKARGAEVFAGTINGRGAFEVAVTRLGRDSTIARVVHLVERAQAQRAPSQTFVDRFARVYTPVVLTLAVLVAVGRAARRRRLLERVDLPLARAAGDFLPVRAGDLDAGLDRVGAGRGGAERRADQGRRAARAARGGALHRVRQDRHPDARPAAGRRRGGHQWRARS